MLDLRQLRLEVQAAAPEEFWFWTLLCVIGAAGLLYLAFRSLSRVRLIEDTPTSRIRSAAQGYVELIGTADVMDGPPIIAPLTQTSCSWYHYRIERRETFTSRGQRRTRWNTVESGTSADLFLIRDETGDCVIDPEGAEVIPSVQQTWSGSTRRPMGGPRSGAAAFLSMGEYRYVERRIHPGDPLYAIGHFKTLGSDVVDSLKEEVGALLRYWKQHPERYLRRFDENSDGEIDLQEWEAVRRAAEIEAVQTRARRSVDPVTHMMERGTDRRRPYILATRPQEHLARKFRWMAAGGATGFLAFGLGVVWLLLARLSG